MENRITVISKSEIAAVRLDKDNDIIPISVGLYRLFLASGAPGREAKDLYEHLIFTARLQETQQVRANNVYLGRGLCWGQAKVKSAKAWLYNAGLIEYVQSRGEGGKLGDVYIKLSFLPRAATVAERLRSADDEEPAAPEDFRDDLTPDLFSDDSGETDCGIGESETDPVVTGSSVSDPPVTGGSIYRPAVDRTPGSKQQMLKVKKEMLKVKKGKGDDACAELPQAAEPLHFPIAQAWFNRYARETAVLISPRTDDYKAAADLYTALDGCLEFLDLAIEAYFGRFRELGLWFAARKASRCGDPAGWVPDWSFRSFIAHYHEIVAAATARPAEEKLKIPSDNPERCPVCGGISHGTMATCATCGMRLADSKDQGKVEEHLEWYESWKSGGEMAVSINDMFRNSILLRK